MKSFILITELGRVKNRISASIFEVIKGVPVVVGSFEVNPQSNKGLDHEAVSYLVNNGKLPKTKLTSSEYINWPKKDYALTVIEGRGLNYVSISSPEKTGMQKISTNKVGNVD